MNATPNRSKGHGVIPDGAVSAGGFSATPDLLQLQMLEQQILHGGYNPPGNARHQPEVEWVRNPLDGSALKDHKGYSVSVSRILATKPLKAELSSRPGPGGKRLTYLSGEGVTRTLNDIFGFDGWNLEIINTNREECVKDDKGRFHVAYTAQVRLTHKKSGTYKEDVGASDSIDRIMGTAIAHALKGSITDALKRAARHFGEKLGNTLYSGDFSISKAPVTLRDALDLYDKERSTSKFGTATKASQIATTTENNTGGKVAPSNNPTVKPRNSIRSAATLVSTYTNNPHTPGYPNSKQQQQPAPTHGHQAQNRVTPMVQHSTNSAGVQSRPSMAPVSSRNLNSAAPARVSYGGSLATPTAPTMPPSSSSRTGGHHRPASIPAGLNPPLSASDRLNQSNMFGGTTTTTNTNNNKENVQHSNQQHHGTGMPGSGRPGTSSGRHSSNNIGEPPVVEWSRPQAGGTKRPLNTTESSSVAPVPAKKMNANPYHK